MVYKYVHKIMFCTIWGMLSYYSFIYLQFLLSTMVPEKQKLPIHYIVHKMLFQWYAWQGTKNHLPQSSRYTFLIKKKEN